MNNKYLLIKGTLILTLSGFITKIIGFIYRIFLSQTIGAHGMGIYQLIFPVQTLCYALTVGKKSKRSLWIPILVFITLAACASAGYRT